jgi:hypothetical protein
MEKEINDLQIGKAGEYLVCADLIVKGYIAFPSEQGLPYDVVAEVNGKLIKIQVKTTRAEKNTPQRTQEVPTYGFNLRRCGKGGRRKYNNSDVDIVAFVALNNRKIGYLAIKDTPMSIFLRDRDFEDKYRKITNRGTPVKGGQYIDDFTFEKAIMR